MPAVLSETNESNASKKITPYIPYYMADGNEVLERWTEPFEDAVGNKATLTVIKYKHKSKTTINQAVIRVQWLSQ